MFADSPILVFITACTVKSAKTVLVLGEVSRYPVKNNADTFLMTFVNKIHKVFRSTVTGSCRKVTCYLIAPATVKRIFCKRHKLNVSVAHFFYIRNKLLGELSIAEYIAVLVFSPRTCVHFIYIDRRVLVRVSFLVLKPLAVVPFITVNFIYTRCVIRSCLAMECIWVGFHYLLH